MAPPATNLAIFQHGQLEQQSDQKKCPVCHKRYKRIHQCLQPDVYTTVPREAHFSPAIATNLTIIQHEQSRQRSDQTACRVCHKRFKIKHICLEPDVPTTDPREGQISPEIATNLTVVPVRQQCFFCQQFYHREHSCIYPIVSMTMDPKEGRLVQYFYHSVCSGRTLFSSPQRNSYLAYLRNPNMHNIVCYFAACYLNEQSMEGYFFKVMNDLKSVFTSVLTQEAIERAIPLLQLLTHICVVNHLESTPTFTFMELVRYQSAKFNINYEATLFIAYEAILRVDQQHVRRLPNDGIQIDFLLECQNFRDIMDFGCSRELLYLLGKINLACQEPTQQRTNEGKKLLFALESLIQNNTEETDMKAAELIAKVAESYLQMARIIIYCRLLGWTRAHSTLQSDADTLAKSLMKLPTSDEYFTAQYPLAPAFWAIVFSDEGGSQVHSALKDVWAERPTNITQALEVAHKLRAETSSETVIPGWFDERLTELHVFNIWLG